LAALQKMSGAALADERYQKFRKLGVPASQKETPCVK
jgi:acetyl-CoA carboxylase alpha subunit